jgi:uncharacterized protein YabE (DUF348 family)
MKNWKILALSALMILGGFALLYTGLRRPVTIYIEDQQFEIQTRAFLVSQALRESGIEIDAQDRVSPSLNSLLAWKPVIQIQKSNQVNLFEKDHLLTAFRTTERIPANLLASQGIQLYPQDQLYWNAELLDPSRPLPLAPVYNLQVRPAMRVVVTNPDGSQRVAYTAGQNVAQALWAVGIPPNAGMQTAPPLEAALPDSAEIQLQNGRELRVKLADREVVTLTNAQTVGQALAQAGIALQGLDYSLPAEGEPLPESGQVRVVRVREEVVLEQQPIPFESEYVADPTLELDQRHVVEPGRYGIEVSRVNVRFEDGQEVVRQTEATWTASQPVSQKLGYGTKVEIRTLDTPSGTIEYWRAVTVYATSYSPCRSGTEKCYHGTASGLPVTRGVIGVTRTWYSWMVGQGVYIPGYGRAVVADVGGGIPGKHWIDLGFTDDDYEAWHSNVTLYFLTPVPESIPWILP